MKKKMCVMLLALSMALCLGACGASGGKSSYNAAQSAGGADTKADGSAPQGSEYYDVEEEIAEDMEAPEDAPADEAAKDDAGEFSTTQEEGTTDTTSSENTAKTDEKIIYTYNYSVETKTFDDFMKSVQQRVNEYGGYMESSEIQGNEEMNISRYANLVIRVPAEKMHSFLEMVKNNSNVTYSNSSSENVTLTYVDMQSHVEALKAEQKSLMDMLEHADTVEAIITIQSRLTDVRYELESYESQLRVYDNRINYSTLYLDVNEVDRESSVATKLSYGEEISQGLSDTLYGMGQGLRDFSIWLIVNLPILLVLAVIIVIIVLIVRAMMKRSERKNADYIAARKASGAWSIGLPGKKEKEREAGKPENEQESGEKKE